MWCGEEKLTGKMRWMGAHGNLLRRSRLQQEWLVTPISGPSFTEWRDVPVVEEEPNHDP